MTMCTADSFILFLNDPLFQMNVCNFAKREISPNIFLILYQKMIQRLGFIMLSKWLYYTSKFYFLPLIFATLKGNVLE